MSLLPAYATVVQGSPPVELLILNQWFDPCVTNLESLAGFWGCFGGTNVA